jgi:hypothetical protein
MEKLMYYDIDRIFEEMNDRRSSGFEYDELWEINNQTELSVAVHAPYVEQVLKLGKFEVVAEDDTDREGYNEEKIWKVYYFSDHDVYVKVFGWWSSNSGCRFEKMKEVKKQLKTIEVYE